MADKKLTQSSRGDWRNRAKFWIATAPEGQSLSNQLNEVLIEVADIKAGHHVLDLASGTGEPAISIAQQILPKGLVTTLDLHPEMLTGARQRAHNLGLTNVLFEVANMECLPFKDHYFDAVTCRFGLMSSDNPVKTLQEARRVLKKGGLSAFMTHGTDNKNILSSVAEKVILEFLKISPRTAPSRRLQFSAKGSLMKVLQAAGFNHVGEREIEWMRIEKWGEFFWLPFMARRFGTKLEGLDSSSLRQLNGLLEQGFAPYLKGDRYEIPSAELIGWGRA